MYHINRYTYVGYNEGAKIKFEVFARTQEFADNLIERLNKVGDYKLKRKRFFFMKPLMTPNEPYIVEKAQLEVVERLEEEYAKNKETEQPN